MYWISRFFYLFWDKESVTLSDFQDVLLDSTFFMNLLQEKVIDAPLLLHYSNKTHSVDLDFLNTSKKELYQIEIDENIHYISLHIKHNYSNDIIQNHRDLTIVKNSNWHLSIHRNRLYNDFLRQFLCIECQNQISNKKIKKWNQFCSRSCCWKFMYRRYLGDYDSKN